MHDIVAGRPEEAPARASSRSRPSLRRLLLWNLAFSLTAILVAGGVGVAGAMAVADTSDELVETVVPARRNNLLMLQHLLDAETGLRGYLETGDQSYLAPFREGRRAFPAAVADQRALSLPAEVDALIDTQEDLGSRWFAEYADPVRAGREVEPRAGKELFDEYRARTEELSEVLQVDRDRLVERLDRIPVVASGTIVVVVLAFVALTVHQAVRTTRLAVRPLEELRTTVEALEGGDRKARSSVTAAAEIEAVGEALNQLADESQRNRTETERRLQTGRALQTIIGRIHRALDAGTVLEATVADLGRLLGVHRVLVLTLAGPVPRAVSLADWSAPATRSTADRGPDEPDLDALALLASEPYRQLLENEGGYYLDDVAAEDLPDDIAAVLARQQATAVAICPVQSGTEMLGAILLLATDGPRVWTHEDQRCVAEVANELGTALTHARLFQRELDMVDQLRALDQSKDDFVSSVSHELRTPLTSIVGYLELLREGDAGEVSEDQDRMLAVVERNTERLLGLIADLLLLSKIDSGHLGTERHPVRIAELIGDAVTTVAPLAATKDHQVLVDADLGDAEIEGDAGQLEQVLLNLLSNAVKFTPGGGRIGVAAHLVGEGVELVITDTGIGIPDAEQHQLFDRFFRSSTAQADAIPGTGLGLAIVHGIVERHGGTIAIDSTAGVGTCVTIWLPRSSASSDPSPPTGTAWPELTPAQHSRAAR